MSIELHPRTLVVQKAEAEISAAILGVWRRHDLTLGELTGILSRKIGEFATFIVRHERHPDDPGKRGDEA